MTLSFASMQSLILRRTPSSIPSIVLRGLTRSYSGRPVLTRTKYSPFRRYHITFPFHLLNTLSTSQTTPIRPNSRTYTTTTPVNIVYAVPERSDLFYHVRFIVTPTSHEQAVFAFSFLDVPPPDVDSPVVIGCLPAQSYITENPEEKDTPGDELTLEDFVPNPNFVEVLHDTVKHVLKEGLDEFWESGARNFQAGWMHIYDQRKTSDLGHVGSPDDIIGQSLSKMERSRPKPINLCHLIAFAPPMVYYS
ncbi:hypothetical protein CPB84DRAFT_1709492 [Gymnopilus junonius]|uniref:Uncharacterized protein n=1 Tax=Gymnopilus junonius TaxID=109634 RepID=A0A9P5TNA4_GYMJU|nr:hypothetical protein CPB84DRAFT_1709492 [Gymnopilus junonius]